MTEETPRAPTALERMLEARSVAVVGASVKPGTLGNQMMLELARGGFDGVVYPVNPGYEQVEGHRCYPSIGDLPEPVDLAILGVSNARVEQAIREAADVGAASVVTFSSLYEEPAPGVEPLAERVAAIARDRGMALCGGNGMGFVNVGKRLRATGFATPDHLREGPVTFLSHSGSAFAALAFNDRGIGFNLLVSSGQEVVTTIDEYMSYALGLETTGVLALLIETIRDPEGFRAALGLAAERGIPVIALKVGRTEVSKAMVTAHSGALAGEHGAFEALFDAYGVHEVRTLDEMADTMELLSCPRRVTTGSGIASIHDSGGERVLFADLASDIGVPFSQISDPTRDTIQALLDPGLEADNPLDAWGTGIEADRIFRESFIALHEDPDTAALVFCVDLTRQGEPHDEGYLQIARDVFSKTTKPFCVLSNLASAVAHEEAALLRDSSMPVLEGSDSGLRALKHLLAERENREMPASDGPEPVAEEVRERWRGRLVTGEAFSEVEGLALLADYGVPVVAAREVASMEEALEAAEGIWPVALKTASPGIEHKSEVDGVRLHLLRHELEGAYDEISARLGPRVTVSAMAPGGVELALGIVRDHQFGPLVLVAAGGVLVELMKDRRLAVPPIDEAHARRLIDRLAIRPLLDGFRGGEAADVSAVARAVSRMSLLARDLGDLIDGLDANPLIAWPGGCVAVDALVIPRRA